MAILVCFADDIHNQQLPVIDTFRLNCGSSPYPAQVANQFTPGHIYEKIDSIIAPTCEYRDMQDVFMTSLLPLINH